MFKKLIILFNLGRKLAKSDALNIITKFNKPPLLVYLIFRVLSFSFKKKMRNLEIQIKKRNYLTR